jgi:uncharacterized Zn finger protein
VSRSRHDGWYERAPKKPPPERGIRVKKTGTTWWGQRWIAALEEVLRGDAGRLSRGRTYARAGRTHDLHVADGKVTAKVTGSRTTPYKITIQLAQLRDAAWTRAIAAMASKAQFSAELLAGRMPQDVDEAFVGAGVSLFPKQRGDLATTCSCPDWGDPCKHVAATHYVLGEALDRDPFLLFELRGRTKEQVLAALRLARRAGGEPPRRAPARGATAKKTAPEHDAPAVPTVKLGEVKAVDYDRPRRPLPPMQFTFEEPVAHGAVLRQLGAPTAWTSEATPADLLAPLVRAAAETARKIAMAEARPTPDEAEQPPHVERSAAKRTPAKRATTNRSTAKRATAKRSR